MFDVNFTITDTLQINRLIYVVTAVIILFLLINRRRFKAHLISPAIAALPLIAFIIWWFRLEIDQLVTLNVRGSAAFGIYVQNAYRISDTEIRFYYYQNTESRTVLQFRDGLVWSPVDRRCICPMSTLLSQCTVEGHLGVARFTTPEAATSDQLTLAASGYKEFFNVNILDARIPKNRSYPHQLGVCVQPIYYQADWTAFVQFFEFWIASGATKFYVYFHSSTAKVQSVLNEYKRLLGDRMELISWSDLPVPQRDYGNFFRDPNTRIFSAGVYAAINDCVLRARSSVQYLSMLDVDELLYTPKGPIISEVRRLFEKHKHAALFSLSWKYYKYQSDTLNIRYPDRLNFDYLNSIRRPVQSAITTEYKELRKLILRPDRVVMVDIHNGLVNELDKRMREFSEIFLDEKDASVIHLRRFNPQQLEQNVDFNITTTENFLRETVRNMNYQWRKRTNYSRVFTSDMGLWQPTFTQTIRDLEQCRMMPFNYRMTLGKGMCRSLANCEPLMTNRDAFVKAEQAWTNVGQRLRYLAYETN